MSIYTIFPIIIPAVFMQVLVMATFIGHCYHNEAMSKRAKAWTIAAISVFNIPAAAAYLFLSRPNENVIADDKEDLDAGGNIRQGTFVLLTVAYEMFCLRILALSDAPNPDPMICWLLSACFVVFILQGLLSGKRHPVTLTALPLVQIVLIMASAYLDNSQSGQFLVLIVLAGIINACPLKLARLHSLIMFIAYLSVTVVKMAVADPAPSADSIISTVYVNMLVFVMVYMAFYMLKKQLIANRLLKEQSLKLEEMAALRERSRITGEIHDTVGHTLVSAVIAIEAGEMLLTQDPDAAREKFILAREQVRQGLLDVRQAVRTIQAGGEKEFASAIQEMADDIKRRTGLGITAILEVETKLLPIQQNVLLNALKECTTNSLKHGRATHADLLIQEYKAAVTMTFTDNGSGAQEFSYGFGLDNMSRQAGSIGGSLTASGETGEGFTVSITIPTGSVTGGDNV
jgi:signal transduction histidine kinase